MTEVVDLSELTARGAAREAPLGDVSSTGELSLL